MKTFDADAEGPDRDRVRVGVSEYVVGADGETLVAYGLGSTVAVAMYDPEAGVGGLATAVLPTREAGEGGAAAKFADAAVQETLRALTERGAGLGSVRAKLAGGARIMELEDLDTGVGDRTVRAARRELDRLGVPVVAEAVGGDRGRTVEFDTATGEMTVETVDSSPETV